MFHVAGNNPRDVKRILLSLTCVLFAACRAAAQLTLAEVQTVIAQAATRASQISTNSVIALTDREGYVLGAWSVNGTTPATDDFTNLVANAICEGRHGGVSQQRSARVQFAHRRLHRAATFSARNKEPATRSARGA